MTRSHSWLSAPGNATPIGSEGGAPTADDFPGTPPIPQTISPPTRYAVTIQDVAAEGSFPAEGHEDRVMRWADATISAWKQASAR
ncbi:DUF5946 family protein [Nonomuraea terrae]|uniref:DUF5946 family protein n=1 Tax=Nonomuraea terrae TaxID=2530383 RepID=UPI0037AC3046